MRALLGSLGLVAMLALTGCPKGAGTSGACDPKQTPQKCDKDTAVVCQKNSLGMLGVARTDCKAQHMQCMTQGAEATCVYATLPCHQGEFEDKCLDDKSMATCRGEGETYPTVVSADDPEAQEKCNKPQ